MALQQVAQISQGVLTTRIGVMYDPSRLKERVLTLPCGQRLPQGTCDQTVIRLGVDDCKDFSGKHVLNRTDAYPPCKLET